MFPGDDPFSVPTVPLSSRDKVFDFERNDRVTYVSYESDRVGTVIESIHDY